MRRPLDLSVSHTRQILKTPCVAPVASLDDMRGSSRWPIMAVAALVLATIGLFIAFPLMLTLLALLAFNGIAYITLLIFRQTTAANLAFLTGVLLVASLLFTDWGFSTPNPRIRISWISLIPACASQLTLISMPLWCSRRTPRTAVARPQNEMPSD